MKKLLICWAIILIVFGILCSIPNTITVRAEKSYQLNDSIPELEIDTIIAKYATGTKAYQMKRTIWCESGYKNVQSKFISKDGLREDSWGIAQINLYWNPKVIKAQALNPEYAIKFMSDNWNSIKWYGYFRKTDTCNIIYK